jgi:GTP-binding protein EngB required for normal cell division
MSISFKHFVQLVEMSDSEFEQLNEISLSDIPGFGWLKGPDTAAKKQKIAQARKMLQGQKDAKSQERAKALDAALANMAAGNKPKKPGEIDDADWDQALGADDRKFNAKMDRMKSMKEETEADTASRHKREGAQFGADVKAGKHKKLSADEMKKYSPAFVKAYQAACC